MSHKNIPSWIGYCSLDIKAIILVNTSSVVDTFNWRTRARVVFKGRPKRQRPVHLHVDLFKSLFRLIVD